MDNVLSFVGVVCVCVAAVSIVGAVSPSGATGKTLSLVTGVFIVCVMLAPISDFFKNGGFEITLPKISESLEYDAEKAYNDAVVTETASRLESDLKAGLMSEGYGVTDVEIKLSVNDDGGIIIDSLRIYIDKTEKRIGKLIADVRGEYKITPEIITR